MKAALQAIPTQAKIEKRNELVTLVKDGCLRTVEGEKQAGEALMELRDKKLYRFTHKTFQAFCVAEFDVERAHAYRLIDFAQLKMSPVGDKIENERQARALLRVPKLDREKVVSTANKGGKLTAEKIQQAAADLVAPKPPEPPKPTIDLDKTGYPIPLPILDDWRQAEAFKEHTLILKRELRYVNEAIRVDEADDKKKDVVFAEVHNTTAAKLNAVIVELECVLPHAVCICEGHGRDECSLCRRRGFLSKFLWESAIPKSTRDTRLNQ